MSRRSEDQVAVATRPDEPSVTRSTAPPEPDTPAAPETAAAARSPPGLVAAAETSSDSVLPTAWAGQFCTELGVPR